VKDKKPEKFSLSEAETTSVRYSVATAHNNKKLLVLMVAMGAADAATADIEATERNIGARSRRWWWHSSYYTRSPQLNIGWCWRWYW
jgi:hypothetical protein